MLLCEFGDDDPLRIKLVAVTSQLKARIKDSNTTKPMSTDTLLSLLKDNDIIIDKSDIYDMIKKEPLQNIIDDIKGNDVIFKGQRAAAKVMEPDQAEDIVSKMAKRAASK
jgi:hypothetical protein